VSHPYAIAVSARSSGRCGRSGYGASLRNDPGSWVGREVMRDQLGRLIDLSLLDSLDRMSYVEQLDEVGRYGEIFDQLLTRAMTEFESRTLMDGYGRSYDQVAQEQSQQ
jgi:hypothetical protein